MTHYETLHSTKESVSDLAAEMIFRHPPAPAGGVLMSFKSTIGKMAKAGVPCYHNEAIISFKPPEAELADYLFWLLPVFTSHQKSVNALKGNTLNKGSLTTLPIALPPLAEQKRIVAKVESMMALCDQLKAQQQERQARHAALTRASLARFADQPSSTNITSLFNPSCEMSPNDLRSAILAAAVGGGLSAQGAVSKSETAKTSTRSFKPESTSRVSLRAGWSSTTIGELNPVFQNGASSRGDSGGTPVVVVRLADIRDHRIVLDSPRELTIDEKTIGKYELSSGDILITRVNGSADIVGAFNLVEADHHAIYCDHFIRMRLPKDRVYPAYLAIVGLSNHLRQQIKNLFISTAGQKTVNQGHIRSLRFPLPALPEQRRIVTKVNQLMARVDELEAHLAAARDTARDLLDALVADLTGPRPE